MNHQPQQINNNTTTKATISTTQTTITKQYKYKQQPNSPIKTNHNKALSTIKTQQKYTNNQTNTNKQIQQQTNYQIKEYNQITKCKQN